MSLAFKALEAVCVLVAAIIVGNSFLKEVRKAQASKAPWYAPYLSLPGVVIIIVLIVPIVWWALGKT